MKMGRNSLLFS